MRPIVRLFILLVFASVLFAGCQSAEESQNGGKGKQIPVRTESDF